jgi:aspartate/methionine/tyrosine aminotransferase
MAFAKTGLHGARFSLAPSGAPQVALEDVLGPAGTEELAARVRSAGRPDGSPAERAAAAAWRAWIAARYGVPEDHVQPAFGTSGGVHLALTALLTLEGTEPSPVAVERPAYGVFRAVTTLNGRDTIDVSRREDHGWAVDLDAADAAFSQGAIALCLTDLHNPTGARLREADLGALEEMAARYGAWVLVDEVYRDLVPGPVGTAYRPGGRIVVTNSLTKACGLGQERLGWILGPPHVVARAARIEEVVVGMPPAAWVHTAAAVAPHADRLVATARERAAASRAVVDRWIATTPGVSWVPPAAGFCGLLTIDGLRDSAAFSRRLREELDCQVVPGTWFGTDGAVRIGYSGAPDEVAAALDVLALGIGALV